MIAEHGAAIVLARRQARGGELALRPVAHELHAGLALDHQTGGIVPVAAGTARIDVAAQPLIGLGHVAERGALHHRDVALAPECDEHVAPAVSGQHVVEQVALPVLLAAERQRDQPGRLQLVERREQFVPVGRRLAPARVSAAVE